MSGRLGCEMMVVLALNIRDICYYEILAKNEKKKRSAVPYLDFLKILTAVEGTQPIYLMTTPDLIAMLQLCPRLDTIKFNVAFIQFVLLI